ncbi:MAG: hypothetical protein HC780_22880 [Leptolyngbyaceae cyanobacterium CSU_1_3]|nr:hypothetical protein [Leptolyngbyaceae cyanobacterium CSU_1_3]
MFIIELTLKNSPVPLSVQRKSAEEADATYKEIAESMRSGGSHLLELTCDRQTEKKLAVLSDNIAAVSVYEKSSASSSGRTPGFFAMAE